jgi:hypothetical protein
MPDFFVLVPPVSLSPLLPPKKPQAESRNMHKIIDAHITVSFTVLVICLFPPLKKLGCVDANGFERISDYFRAC